MADNFGLKIGIEGEKEFKKALSEINQSFKVLGSEMKLVSSQFDKNDKSVQALSARNTVLNKEIEAQKNKVETLRAALQNAADSFGENDRRTQNWQIQLNNAEAALNSMERELSDNERAIEALSQEETDAADATERLSREIAQQEDALAGMKRAYSNAVLQYGKGSSAAKELEGRISQLSGELRENRERMKDAGDVAEDLGDSLEDASEGADKLGSGLSVATVAMGNLISSGIQAALNGIKELGSAIWNLDEATEEYRVAQGKLTTAFEAAGYSGAEVLQRVLQDSGRYGHGNGSLTAFGAACPKRAGHHQVDEHCRRRLRHLRRRPPHRGHDRVGKRDCQGGTGHGLPGGRLKLGGHQRGRI